MTKPFDPSRPCTTRDGRPVRILCTDAKGPHSLIGLVLNEGVESPRLWYPDGSWHPDAAPQAADLINVPTKRKGWIGIYPYSASDLVSAKTSNIYPSKDAAINATCDSFIHYIQIEFDE